MTVFVYDYPDGQQPAYWVQDEWVYSYPKGAKRWLVRGEFWHPFPQGGPPELREHQGYLFPLSDPDNARYYLREVEQ